jgi:IS66 C-terminal element
VAEPACWAQLYAEDCDISFKTRQVQDEDYSRGYTLIETAKVNNVEPQVWVADVLARYPTIPLRTSAICYRETLPPTLLSHAAFARGRSSPWSSRGAYFMAGWMGVMFTHAVPLCDAGA